MKTYSLLSFLSEPINNILDNEEDYNYSTLKASSNNSPTLHNSVNNITIPIIQRDYAQGRDDNKDLREQFIGKIFNHLENKKELKLDFIYGAIDKNQSFLPLDGQQRLTTLFLLHWYIIKAETKNNSEEEIDYKILLSKFSYETRDTSRRFFKELVDFEFEGNPKYAIEQSYWFNDNFDLDPTISGALNSLETIHELYQKSTQKSNLLSSLKDDVIVFYVLPMDQFKLTDDLYIKLNARGKALSSFENFKADLVGYIKSDTEFDTTETLENGTELYHYDIIASKFDNFWSDLFWMEAKKYLSNKEDKENNSVDTYFFRFIHRILINNFIVDYIGADINKNDVYKQLLKKEKELYYTNFELYNTNNLINTKFVSNLEIILDFYSKHYYEILECIKPLWASDSYSFNIYKTDNFTMPERMVFDAINEYILMSYKDFEIKKFKEWMRIVWNLISDPDIRSIEANKTVMNVIRSLSKFSNNVYENLKNGNIDNLINSLNNIHKAQLIEEKRKATYILTDRKEWENIIHEAESHLLYEGNIDFLLSDVETAKQLKNRFAISKQLFHSKGPVKLIEDESYSLMRYLIAQYEEWDSLKKFNFMSNDVNWKNHLRRNSSVKKNILELIELNNIEDIKSSILIGIKQDSKFTQENSNVRIAHKNLYYSNTFHQWMQSDGVNSVVNRGPHIYIERSRSWYSRVMIDGYRNEVISATLKRFALNPENRELNNSGYYWGETLEFWKEIENEMKVSFYFDSENKLKIGLWGEQNPNINDGVLDDWLQVYEFDINNITASEQIDDFIIKIEDLLKSDSNCKIKSLFG